MNHLAWPLSYQPSELVSGCLNIGPIFFRSVARRIDYGEFDGDESLASLQFMHDARPSHSKVDLTHP
jgi:hypothetical protein